MSHFTCLVIGSDVDEQLAPFHEFECTGKDDKYVQEIDETEKLRDSYNKRTTSRYREELTGKLFSPYENQFYREPTEEEKPNVEFGTGCGNGISYTSKDWGDGKGYRPKVHYIPEGFKEVELPYTQLMTFAEFIEEETGRETVAAGRKPDLKKKHKYGYTLLDEKGEVIKCIDRSNPNAKWDWYSVGGRWTGFFKLKKGRDGEVGRPGLMTEPAKPGYADQVKKGDIDIEGMMDEAGDKARSDYQTIKRILGGTIPRLEHYWSDIIDDNNERFNKMKWDERREFYHNQEALKAIERARKSGNLTEDERDLLVWLRIEDYQCDEERFVTKARNRALSTFAVVKDGKWYERGEMGWWACVSNEKDEDKWLDEFAALIKGLPDDTLLTVVDCHI